ncbi:MAG: HNH endonuclease [Gemmatimonadetes bacterium]|nr:HNH endonuclease [Gemmatimonadota bacterium]
MCFAAVVLGRKLPRHKDAGWGLLEQIVRLYPDRKSCQAAVAKVRRASMLVEEEKPKRRQRHTAIEPFAASLAFLRSWAWLRLRMKVLEKRGARCECCGATRDDGVRIHVDHIKPRRHFPEMALEESNLQILCDQCNRGKGNWSEKDWRSPPRMGSGG